MSPNNAFHLTAQCPYMVLVCAYANISKITRQLVLIEMFCWIVDWILFSYFLTFELKFTKSHMKEDAHNNYEIPEGVKILPNSGNFSI